MKKAALMAMVLMPVESASNALVIVKHAALKAATLALSLLDIEIAINLQQPAKNALILLALLVQLDLQ